MGPTELVSFISGCPILETLHVYFYIVSDDMSFTKVLAKPSSNDDFTWTYFNINKGCFELGIVGNFHSMVEAFLDVFSVAETEFVDPILNLIRDDRSEFHYGLLDDDEDLYLELCHSTSKVKFYFYGLYVFTCVVWF